MALALRDLLERSADGLGISLDYLLPMREGCAEATDGPEAGSALHQATASTGLEFAKEVRQKAMEFDMAKDSTLLNESDE